MFLSIEEPIINEDSTFLERLGLGGETLLIGMLIVFAMLFVIYLALVAIRAILGRKKDEAAQPKEAQPLASAPAPQITQTPATAAQATDDRALVAAISAAIAAYTGEAPTSFRVVSFKKRGSK